MSSDMNLNKPNINVEQRQVAINGTTVARTLKKLAAPVFDFFTKSDDTPKEEVKNYDEEIEKVQMQSAITQKILNDVDPKARKKINIVI